VPAFAKYHRRCDRRSGRPNRAEEADFHLPDVNDQAILTLSDPITGSRDDPSALAESDYRLGLINLGHNPTHGMFSKKHNNNRLTFTQGPLL
jgi:hypothetical protein